MKKNDQSFKKGDEKKETKESPGLHSKIAQWYETHFGFYVNFAAILKSFTI